MQGGQDLQELPFQEKTFHDSVKEKVSAENLCKIVLY